MGAIAEPGRSPFRTAAVVAIGLLAALLVALIVLRAPLAFILIVAAPLALIVLWWIAIIVDPRWSFEHAMEATRSPNGAERRSGVGGLVQRAQELTDEQLNTAAMRMGELADDADHEVRWLSAKGLAAFAPRLGGAARSALFGRAVKLTEDAYPQARGAAAMAVAGLVGGAAGDTKRHATVTLVELFEVLTKDKMGEVVDALQSMTDDPDPIVADQARDSIRAIDQFVDRQSAKAAT